MTVQGLSACHAFMAHAGTDIQVAWKNLIKTLLS